MKTFCLLTLFVIFSCSNTPTDKINFVKASNLIKKYKLIDFYKINNTDYLFVKNELKYSFFSFKDSSYINLGVFDLIGTDISSDGVNIIGKINDEQSILISFKDSKNIHFDTIKETYHNYLRSKDYLFKSIYINGNYKLYKKLINEYNWIECNLKFKLFDPTSLRIDSNGNLLFLCSFKGFKKSDYVLTKYNPYSEKVNIIWENTSSIDIVSFVFVKNEINIFGFNSSDCLRLIQIKKLSQKREFNIQIEGNYFVDQVKYFKKKFFLKCKLKNNNDKDYIVFILDPLKTKVIEYKKCDGDYIILEGKTVIGGISY